MATRKPKIKVWGVEKSVYSSSGFTNPPIKYEDFVHPSKTDLKKMFGGHVMSAAELRRYVQLHYHQLPIRPSMGIEEISDLLWEENIGQSDNTYNWSWWGPVLQFTLLGPAARDPYKDGVILVKRHLGGDVRGNYDMAIAIRLESAAEEMPWTDCRLEVGIKTDKGIIHLDAEDDEAYHFVVAQDETGTWNEGDDITYDDLTRELNWEDAPDLWS